jgi:hypothetical protein
MHYVVKQVKNKIPDQVVFNSASGQYDASLKTYGTNVSAPRIETLDTGLWKSNNIRHVNSQFKARFQSLKEAFDSFSEEFEYNNKVYASKFNFEPVVGETYYLYKNKAGHDFLSIIPSEECNFEFLGAFYLNEDKVWKKK